MKPKNLLSLAFCLLLSIQGLFANTTSELPLDRVNSLFVSERHAFRADFKLVTPEIESSPVETEIGTSMLHSYMAEMNEHLGMVMVCDYPSGYNMSDDYETTLEGAYDGASTSFEGMEIELKEDIIQQGFPGIYFEANNGEYYMQYEIILVNDRLYQVALLKEGTYPSSAFSDNYFDSFEILEDTDLWLTENGTFVSYLSGFSVDYFGNIPTVRADIVTTDLGDITMNSYNYTDEESNVFTVTAAEFPLTFIEASESSVLLEGAKEGVLEEFGITELDIDKSFTFGGHEALTFKGHNDRFYTEYFLILVDNTLYQVATLGEAYLNESTATAFFNSFEILD